jgi:outer membrane lipoprotein SlyB
MTVISYSRVASAALGTLMLASCGGGNGSVEPVTGGLRIACAVGSGAFEQACFVDRAETPEGLVLTLRKPDGGFQRLRVTEDGSGVVAADGAEPAVVTLHGPEEIEVAIGGTRYRLPAHRAPGKDA